MPKTSYICNCDVIHEDIVNDVKSKMQPKDDYIQLASLFKLFGDGTRVQILHALEQSEMCVCDLAVLLGVTKSAISHQLKALRLANLVKFRREAQIVHMQDQDLSAGLPSALHESLLPAHQYVYQLLHIQ